MCSSLVAFNFAMSIARPIGVLSLTIGTRFAITIRTFRWSIIYGSRVRFLTFIHNIMQAVILAAGMGKRLGELTQGNTKCMVKVNGVSLINRLLHQLETVEQTRGLERIVIVTGYEGKKLQDYIATLGIKTPIEYVENPIYATTNNIYSLYLAKDYLLQDDTLLFESDLIFSMEVINRLLDDPYPSLALVDKFESWMDGTVVTLDEERNIKRFIPGSKFSYEATESYFKTVNVYKFSKQFSSTHYVPFLEAYSKALGNNEYYEQVLRVIAMLDQPEIKALPLNGELWYEIDDVQDLDIAESMFCPAEEQIKRMECRYGGYWRYPKVLDFCYLVNPYFPNKRMMSELGANMEQLIRNYPSGMRVNSLLAAKYFGLRAENVIVGNGAAELIQALMEHIEGNIGIIYPTFEEYPNRLPEERRVSFIPDAEDFAYTAQDIIAFFDRQDISTLTLVNPDNPSGNFISKDGLLQLIRWSAQKDIRLIVDESFVDFSEDFENNSLLHNDILAAYPHLMVMKSISKSYGVPGLRLGILASGDSDTIALLKKKVSIWNINSLAEFYLQIYGKYEKVYKAACHTFIAERNRFMTELQKVSFLRVLPSQANYFMCEVTARFTAAGLAQELLSRYDILIKNACNKRGIRETGRQYIRIAVRDTNDNNALIAAMRELERM